VENTAMQMTSRGIEDAEDAAIEEEEKEAIE